MVVVRIFILHPIGKTAGFQVTDEFVAQLPQQLIVPSSHLQLFESIGEGKLQTSHRVCAELVIFIQATYTTCIHIPWLSTSFSLLAVWNIMKSWSESRK